MSLILIYNDRTETIEFMSAFDEYCSIFDEICRIIMETFNLYNLLSDYHIVYFDHPYGTWINFNIHVIKRITELLRSPTSRTLKIRIQPRQKNLTMSMIKKKIMNVEEPKIMEDLRCAHSIIWLDEHIGHPLWHKQLKRDCQAMINTNTSFITNDNIDILIQNNPNFLSRSYSKYITEANTDCLCPFQCTLVTVDNTDKFFGYLDKSLKLTRSLSIIVSEYFAKDILPIIISRIQKKLLPHVLFLYILCWNINNYYDWALGYIENNNNLPIKTRLILFNDEKALFVRILNEISSHLTSEANSKRLQNDNWYALQYYSAARQLFLNSLPWNTCYTLRELDHLDQLIKESEIEVNESYIEKYRLNIIDNKYNETDDQLSQQCIEILEGI